MSERQLLAEYQTFEKLTDALLQAATAAEEMARHRPDQAYAWGKMAEAYRVGREAVFRLASESVVKS